MREVQGDIFSFSPAQAICITTNGYVKQDGSAVMGAGMAKEAAEKWDMLPSLLGEVLGEDGNHVAWLLGPEDTKGPSIVSFPVKEHWQQPAKLALIRQSCNELVELTNQAGWTCVALTRPGCGNGQLSWVDKADAVRDVLEYLLDDRFVVVDYRGGEVKEAV